MYPIKKNTRRTSAQQERYNQSRRRVLRWILQLKHSAPREAGGGGDYTKPGTKKDEIKEARPSMENEKPSWKTVLG